MFPCHKPSVAKGFNMNCGEHCEKVCLIPAGGERLSVLTLSSVSKSSHQGFLFIYNIHNMPLAWIKKHDFEGRNLSIWKRRKGTLRRKHRRIEVLKEHSWEACSVHGGAPSTRLLVFLPRNTSSTLLKWGSAKPEDALTTWEHAWQPRGTDVRKGKRDGKKEKVGNSGGKRQKWKEQRREELRRKASLEERREDRDLLLLQNPLSASLSQKYCFLVGSPQWAPLCVISGGRGHGSPKWGACPQGKFWIKALSTVLWLSKIKKQLGFLLGNLLPPPRKFPSCQSPAPATKPTPKTHPFLIFQWHRILSGSDCDVGGPPQHRLISIPLKRRKD